MERTRDALAASGHFIVQSKREQELDYCVRTGCGVAVSMRNAEQMRRAGVGRAGAGQRLGRVKRENWGEASRTEIK